MKEYVYKIVHKYVRNLALLEKYGFRLYQEDKTEDNIAEIIMARPIKYGMDTPIFKSSVALIEYLYKEAKEDKDMGEDFAEYKFDENGKLVIDALSEETLKSLTECQLCCYTYGVGAYQLFINAPDNNQYFNSVVLDQVIKPVINGLLSAGVIYKKKIKR